MEESGAAEDNQVDTDIVRTMPSIPLLLRPPLLHVMQEEPLAPYRQLAGWIGTPDPKKYAAGTNQLTQEQVRPAAAARTCASPESLAQSHSLAVWPCRCNRKWKQATFRTCQTGEKVGPATLHTVC